MSSAQWRLFRLGLKVLTHYGLVMPYGNKELDPGDAGNGLLPGQPITQTNTVLSSVRFSDIHLRTRDTSANNLLD